MTLHAASVWNLLAMVAVILASERVKAACLAACTHSLQEVQCSGRNAQPASLSPKNERLDGALVANSSHSCLCAALIVDFMSHAFSARRVPYNTLVLRAKAFCARRVILPAVMAAWGQGCRITGRAGATALRSQGLSKFNGQTLNTHSHQVRSMASGALEQALTYV